MHHNFFFFLLFSLRIRCNFVFVVYYFNPRYILSLSHFISKCDQNRWAKESEVSIWLHIFNFMACTTRGYVYVPLALKLWSRPIKKRAHNIFFFSSVGCECGIWCFWCSHEIARPTIMKLLKLDWNSHFGKSIFTLELANITAG